MMEQYDLTLMFIRLSSNGFSDEPHPRFISSAGSSHIEHWWRCSSVPTALYTSPNWTSALHTWHLWAAASLNWPSSMWRYLIGCVLTGENWNSCFGHMGAGWLPGVPHSNPFLEHFCSTNRGQLSVSEAFGVHLAASNWFVCFMVEEIDQPIECVQTHFMLFFFRPTTTPLTILVSCEGWRGVLGFRVI
jgi:hypothetical protein